METLEGMGGINGHIKNGVGRALAFQQSQWSAKTSNLVRWMLPVVFDAENGESIDK
jgi:hypothetical protein